MQKKIGYVKTIPPPPKKKILKYQRKSKRSLGMPVNQLGGFYFLISIRGFNMICTGKADDVFFPIFMFLHISLPCCSLFACTNVFFPNQTHSRQHPARDSCISLRKILQMEFANPHESYTLFRESVRMRKINNLRNTYRCSRWFPIFNACEVFFIDLRVFYHILMDLICYHASYKHTWKLWKMSFGTIF
jgi:hypothetical protein